MKAKILMMLLAGITLFAACSGGNNSSSKADSVNKEAIADSIKLVKTAEMKLSVKNVTQAAETVSLLTDVYGGMVTHHQMQTNVMDSHNITLNKDSLMKVTVYNATADMTVKIPSEKVEDFMDKLNHLSVFVDERKMDVEDRTLDYLSESLKAQNREQSIKLGSHIKLTTGVVDSIRALKDDIIDRKISNLRTNDAVKYSVMNLSLYQNNAISKETVVNDDISTYNISLIRQVGLAISKGGYYFSELVVWLAQLWAFVLMGGAIWLGIRLYKGRKNGKLPQPS